MMSMRRGRCCGLIVSVCMILSCLTSMAQVTADRLRGVSRERYEIDSVLRTLDCRADDPLIGRWQLTQGGEIAIAPADDMHGSLLMLVIDSPDRSIMPGTVIGLAIPSAVRGHYDAVFYNNPGVKGSGTGKFMLMLNDASHLSFKSVKHGVKFNPLRLIPYMFRGVITSVDNRPDNHVGAIRVGRPDNYRLTTPRKL